MHAPQVFLKQGEYVCAGRVVDFNAHGGAVMCCLNDRVTGASARSDEEIERAQLVGRPV
jgi:hypothetical protein